MHLEQERQDAIQACGSGVGADHGKKQNPRGGERSRGSGGGADHGKKLKPAGCADDRGKKQKPSGSGDDCRKKGKSIGGCGDDHGKKQSPAGGGCRKKQKPVFCADDYGKKQKPSNDILENKQKSETDGSESCKPYLPVYVWYGYGRMDKQSVKIQTRNLRNLQKLMIG